MGEGRSVRDSGRDRKTSEEKIDGELNQTIGIVPIVIAIALFAVVAELKWRSDIQNKNKPKVRVANPEKTRKGIFSRLRGR